MELSYRRRRRLVALAVVAAVVGGLAAAIALLPAGEKADRGPTGLPAGGNETTASRPKPHRQQRLTTADRTRLKSTIALFVSSSVARHHPERSWSVVGPALREGLTRKQWSAGNIPVVPYPAAGVDLLTLQSMVDETALVEVMLEPPPESRLPRKTFQIQLHRLPRAPRGWLVSSWVPEGVSGSGREAAASEPASAAGSPSHLSTVWLFGVLGLLFGSLILIPTGVFARDAYQTRRATAEWNRSRENR